MAQPIEMTAKGLRVPDEPIIPFIEGDGVGPDIWRAAQTVLDAAVEMAYGGSRGVVWQEVFAGENDHARFGAWLPAETIEAIRRFRVAIKGPLATPVAPGWLAAAFRHGGHPGLFGACLGRRVARALCPTGHQEPRGKDRTGAWPSLQPGAVGRLLGPWRQGVVASGQCRIAAHRSSLR